MDYRANFMRSKKAVNSALPGTIRYQVNAKKSWQSELCNPEPQLSKRTADIICSLPYFSMNLERYPNLC